MTEKGFSWVALGFTGEKAAKWKEAFLNAFDAKPISTSRQLLLQAQIMVAIEEKQEQHTAQIQALDQKIDTEIDSIKKRLTSERINEFPEGCGTLPFIVSTWFPTMNPAVVSDWLSINGHPTRPFRRTLDAENTVRETMVFLTEGINELKELLRKTSTHYKTTPMNHYFTNPQLTAPFRIKIESNSKCWMPLNENVKANIK